MRRILKKFKQRKKQTIFFFWAWITQQIFKKKKKTLDLAQYCQSSQNLYFENLREFAEILVLQCIFLLGKQWDSQFFIKIFPPREF